MTLPPAYGSSGGGGGGGVSDSLTEQATGLTDLDGDALYQKTVTLASITGGLENIAHGITGYKRLHSVRGSLVAGALWSPIPMASGSANVGMQIDVDATNVRIIPGSFWSVGQLTDLQITITYSKT